MSNFIDANPIRYFFLHIRKGGSDCQDVKKRPGNQTNVIAKYPDKSSLLIN